MSDQNFREWMNEGAAQNEASSDTGNSETPKPAEGETPAGESETKAKGAESNNGEKKQGDGWQRRIDRLTRDKYRQQAEIEVLRRQLAEKDGSAKGGEVAKSAGANGKPKIADFATYDEYVEALTDWKVEQAKAKDAPAEAKKPAEVDTAAARHLNKQIRAARAKYADFEDVVDNGDIPISPAVQQFILDSDHAGDLMYWLGSNPEQAEEIAEMSPTKAMRALTAIEAKLSNSTAKGATSDKGVTKAPAPPSKVGGTSTGSDDPANETFAQYAKRMNAKERKG